MRYEFHPEAEQELYEAAARYESEVSDLGFRFADEVERVIRLLIEHPEDVICVVAVAHGSREPGYWRPRVQDR